MSGQAKTVAGTGALVLLLAMPLISYYEGYVPRGYADPVGIPTACYGHTGPEVRIGQKYTKAQCDALLTDDIRIAQAQVKRCIRVSLKPYEEAALVSFTFNVGGKALCGSTLARRVNAGELPAACSELSKWVYSRGIKFPGLVKRRIAERAMCEGVSNVV